MPDQSLKRGAIPSPRSVLAAAVPHVPLIGAPPHLIMKPAKISMWGNDVHGDCVTAEEAFAKACNNPEIFISDNEVIAWATRHGVLEGANLTQVMTWMRSDGFADGPLIYDDGPYLSVDWTNAGTLQSAIARGPVKIGLAADQLEATWRAANGQSGWFATGYHRDPNVDHCVTLCGYGTMSWLAQQLGVKVPAGVDGTQPGYAMFTWDSIGIIDAPSMIAITAEAWLRQPTTVTQQQLKGHLWHTLRRADGGWSGLGDVQGQFAIPGPVAAVAGAGGAAGETQWMFTTNDGHLWHTLRRADGGWSGLGDVQGQFAVPGPVAVVAAATGEPGETQFMMVI